jgi:hypothetical protein
MPPGLAAAVASLLKQSGAALGLDQGSAPIGNGRGFLLRPPEGGWLHELADAGVDIYPVQGLRGLMRGLSPSLGVTVIGLPADAEGRLVAGAVGMLGRLLPDDCSVMAVDQPAAGSAVGQYLPQATVADLGANEAMELLLRPPHAAAAIVTTTELAGLFAAAARAVCGAGDLAVVLRAREGVVACEHLLAPGTPVDGAGLALAAAWTLYCAGHYRESARVHNALLRALEDGLHTAGVELALPYCRQVDDIDMLRAVEERIGQAPQRLASVELEARPVRHLQRVV